VILIDTSVWVDHFRLGDRTLAQLLNSSEVLAHPFVIGELALGNLRQRQLIRETLGDLPLVIVASDQEVLHFIDRNRLFESGLGYVDTHLLAATRLAAGTTLWTRDKRLHLVANRLGLAASLPA
jgi:predicted nucleic acid-binding protein